MRFSLIALLLLAGTANAEVFRCNAGILWEYGDEIVVIATGDADSDSGTIEVAGTVHEAEYSVRGFDRRWNFGSATDQGLFGYAFVISPDGRAHYYDFALADEDGRANAAQSFICVKGQAEIDAESNRLDPMAANADAAYIFAIQQKVERNWVRPPTAIAGLKCIVNVRQLPGGEVVSVNIGECNADSTVRRSIEAAVYKASPLPAPSDPSVFNRNLRLEFRPTD